MLNQNNREALKRTTRRSRRQARRNRTLGYRGSVTPVVLFIDSVGMTA